MSDDRPADPGRFDAWRWPLAAMVIAALALVGYWLTLARIDRAAARLAAAPGELARGLGEAAKSFLSGDVTHRFVSSLPVSENLGPGRLEVVVETTQEIVNRTDGQRAFWDLLSLGRTEVEIRVPVTWRWTVALDQEWTATLEDQILTVVAPAAKSMRRR